LFQCGSARRAEESSCRRSRAGGTKESAPVLSPVRVALETASLAPVRISWCSPRHARLPAGCRCPPLGCILPGTMVVADRPVSALRTSRPAFRSFRFGCSSGEQNQHQERNGNHPRKRSQAGCLIVHAMRKLRVAAIGGRCSWTRAQRHPLSGARFRSGPDRMCSVAAFVPSALTLVVCALFELRHLAPRLVPDVRLAVVGWVVNGTRAAMADHRISCGQKPVADVLGAAEIGRSSAPRHRREPGASFAGEAELKDTT